MSVRSVLSSLLDPGLSLRLRRYRRLAKRIELQAADLRSRSDEELKTMAGRIGWEAVSGVPLRNLLPEAFGLVRETVHRVMGKSYFPVQLMAGAALFEGQIIEMQTGEGKTLTAALPVFIHALAGKGCHVITSNDYLASRDAELLTPIYAQLGLTVGCLLTDSTPEQRREAYRRDITYGTAQEFGFDFLRDRLQQPAELLALSEVDPTVSSQVTTQRGHHVAIIDEADSILLDEARTPLIIGLEEPNEPSTVYLYRWCRRTISKLKRDVDFTFEPELRRAELTETGCRTVLLLSKSTLLASITTERIYHHIEMALAVELGFERERDYVVVDNTVQIVDESTGRIMDGRKWQHGMHQSIEAKERLPITAATGEAARITLQSYFRLYRHVAGMTGTAWSARHELKNVYGRRVTVIPTNRPCLRVGLPPRIFATMSAKLAAVANEVKRRHECGQPTLIGTPSVSASESLGRLITAHQLQHQVLNALHHEKEAEYMSRAGEPEMLTIATNMAGRGTDIHVGTEARLRGGLHVIATEMHSSCRIDRQLVGRAARQGDPGSFQFFLSLEDELFDCLPPRVRNSYRRRARPDVNGELSSQAWFPVFRRTQRHLERLHLRNRRDLLRQEKQRAVRYRQIGLDPCLELTEA